MTDGTPGSPTRPGGIHGRGGPLRMKLVHSNSSGASSDIACCALRRTR